jgi:peptidoglycan-N-acetylglucosamine deacetylase
MRIKMVLHRYEAIFLISLLILTGSIGIVSKTADEGRFTQEQKYPYCVSLTFDDGPYPGYTEKLVKLLEDKNAYATFFLIGSHVDRYPALVDLLLSGGNEAAIHTYDHPNLTRFNDRDILSELDRTREAIFNKSGITTRLFRPPGGRIDARVMGVARKNGYTPILWTVLPRDLEPAVTKKMIVDRVLAEARNYGIICVHDGSRKTLDAVGAIIDGLRMKGYRFVTVSEIIREKEKIELARKEGRQPLVYQ